MPSQLAPTGLDETIQLMTCLLNMILFSMAAWQAERRLNKDGLFAFGVNL